MFAFLSINGWFCRYFLILELSMSWNPCLKFWWRNKLHFSYTVCQAGKVTSFSWKSFNETFFLYFSNTVVETTTHISFWRNRMKDMARQSAIEVTRIIEHPVHMQVLHHNPTWLTLRFLSARGIRGSEKALAFLKEKILLQLNFSSSLVIHNFVVWRICNMQYTTLDTLYHLIF